MRHCRPNATPPVNVVRELAPGSAFLRGLNANRSAWRGLPVQAYWTPLDLLVIPSTNTRCEFGQTRRIPCLFHPWMPRNPEVMSDIAAKIAALPRNHVALSRRPKTGDTPQTPGTSAN